MTRLIIIAILYVCAIVACTSTAQQSPAQSVYAIESSYAAALQIAVAYKRLPPCPGPVICADAAVVNRLQKADDAAAALLQGAQTTVRSGATGADLAIKAAQEAASAFTTITSTLKVH